MKPLAALVVVGMSLLTAAALAADPTPEAESADDAICAVATTALQAALESKWEIYVDQFDRIALREFAEMLRPVLVAAEQKGPDSAAAILPLFADATSLDEVLKLAPREFFLRFLQGTAAQSPAAASLLTMKSRVIGAVHESPTVAHVVIRNTRQLGNVEHTQMAVLSFRKHGDVWRLSLTDELKMVALSFQLSLGGSNVTEAQATVDAVPEE